MTKLSQLLTPEEIKQINRNRDIMPGYPDINKDFQEVTLGELQKIDLIIIATEEIGVGGPGSSVSKCINILTDRAIEKNLPLF